MCCCFWVAYSPCQSRRDMEYFYSPWMGFQFITTPLAKFSLARPLLPPHFFLDPLQCPNTQLIYLLQRVEGFRNTFIFSQKLNKVTLIRVLQDPFNSKFWFFCLLEFLFHVDKMGSYGIGVLWKCLHLCNNSDLFYCFLW